jgi:L-ascorbate metabolism protein UlaG (beta-lactamase superfamily)
LTIDGKTIFHAGDTALFSDMKLIGELNHIDLFSSSVTADPWNACVSFTLPKSNWRAPPICIGWTIFHAGDTALFSDMKLIGELNHIDLAFLPIGDNFTAAMTLPTPPGRLSAKASGSCSMTGNVL